MKKTIEYIVIVIFFGISLFYTNKISEMIKNKDPIMKSILSNTSNHKIDSVNALVVDNMITPGLNGCDIDVNKSYKNMKKINEYQEKLLKYRDIIPEITINNIYDKYIGNGNIKKRAVSIIININSNLDIINNYKKEDKINIFIDSNLIKEEAFILNNKYIHIYNGGNNNNYDDITIEWMNDVIIDNYNESKYCINKNRNDDNLLICSRNRMHTISPKIIINNGNMYDNKMLITNGSIIYFDELSINKLDSIVKYLKNKGYEILFLNELLDEDVCNN